LTTLLVEVCWLLILLVFLLLRGKEGRGRRIDTDLHSQRSPLSLSRGHAAGIGAIAALGSRISFENRLVSLEGGCRGGW
jgi:hypothetical protein